MSKHNNLLGTFFLEGIAPAPRGQPQIDVTFDIDSRHELIVTAVEKSTGKTATFSGKSHPTPANLGIGECTDLTIVLSGSPSTEADASDEV